MKILYITHRSVLPSISGDTIVSYQMIKCIASNSNNKIDLCNFTDTDIYNDRHLNELKKYCKNIYEVKRKFRKDILNYFYCTFFTRKAFFSYHYYDKKMAKLIQELVSNNKYDIIYFDHLHMAQYIKFIDKKKHKNIKLIINEHNVEFTIWDRYILMQRNLLRKIPLTIHRNRLRKEEIELCNKADIVYTISDEDKKVLNSCKLSNVYTKKPLTEFERVKFENSKFEYNLLFMGSMDWHPNEEAVIWFIENVFYKLDNRYNFYIVGKNPSDCIKRYSSERIIVTGRVESVNSYIEKSDIMLIPMFNGGGVKIKLIEGLAKGIPIISTRFGALGIEVNDGKQLFICNTAEEFVKKIQLLENSMEERIKIAMNGFEFYQLFNRPESYIRDTFHLP